MRICHEHRKGPPCTQTCTSNPYTSFTGSHAHREGMREPLQTGTDLHAHPHMHHTLPTHIPSQYVQSILHKVHRHDIIHSTSACQSKIDAHHIPRFFLPRKKQQRCNDILLNTPISPMPGVTASKAAACKRWAQKMPGAIKRRHVQQDASKNAQGSDNSWPSSEPIFLFPGLSPVQTLGPRYPGSGPHGLPSSGGGDEASKRVSSTRLALHLMKPRMLFQTHTTSA